MTLVKTAVEAEGVFQLCIKITNWISKINMEEKVDTRIKAWQSLFPSTRNTSRQCLKLPLYPHKVISKSNGGRESCITKVARSHNPASILGIICTSRWRGGREFELSATEIEWEESGPVDDSEMSLAGADFSGRERERGCLALAEL